MLPHRATHLAFFCSQPVTHFTFPVLSQSLITISLLVFVLYGLAAWQFLKYSPSRIDVLSQVF
jgi:hypothetical protein